MPWSWILTTSRYHTLKGRLLAWLLIPLVLLSVAQMASIYSETQNTSTELFDRMLVSLALSISENALASEGDLLTVDLLELVERTTNDNLYYKVLGPSGSFLVGYHDMPEPPGGLKQINNHVELYDAEYLGQPVRVIAVSRFSERPSISGWSSTFVAQTLQDRKDFVASAISDNFLRLILLFLIVTVFLLIGVSRALRPMKNLQSELDARDINDLTPLHSRHLPRELGTLAETINDLFGRLEHQIQLTKRFLENASHQLRTPIAALTLQSDLTVRSAKSEEARKTATKMKKNIDRVARLAHQLLRLSYSESRAWKDIQEQELDLADVAEQSIKVFLSDTHCAEVVRSLDAAPATGKVELLKEVVSNLLENAHKYAGTGSAICVSTRTQNGRSVLEVCDRGPGIPRELRQLVTERFFRAQNDEDGSGLGLAIVKEIVIEHGGEMEITSGVDGRGTCVRCWLPTRTPGAIPPTA